MIDGMLPLVCDLGLPTNCTVVVNIGCLQCLPQDRSSFPSIAGAPILKLLYKAGLD